MMTLKIVPYLKLVRPLNAAMAIAAVALGYWLGDSHLPLPCLPALAIAAFCAVGFGNTINDIVDLPGDRINHPERPLPKGQISLPHAQLFALALALLGCGSAATVSLQHVAATAVPLGLLALYARYLKATPFVGNILVSLLVAYPLFYGGLGAPLAHHLAVPAALAFLLNLCREIVKDIEDRDGDLATGTRTTAALGVATLAPILLSIGVVYLGALWLPYALGHFAWVYALIGATLVTPLHLMWMTILLTIRSPLRWPAVSLTLKFELLSGLAALATDRLLVS